jgi:hypothetical protein
MLTLNENLAAGIANAAEMAEIFTNQIGLINTKKAELETSVNLKKAELTQTVETAVAGMAGNVSPFGDLRCFTTLGGQPTWFFGIPKMTYEQLRPDGLLGTGTHEAFIEAGVEKSTLWIAAYPASMVDGEIVSQPASTPRTGRTLDEEIIECRNTEIVGYAGKHRLMSIWDWSLLMHLSIVSGYQPLGNTNYGKSHVKPWLSGRGTASTNAGSMGRESAHNNNAGIFDLVGNVWEQLQKFELQDGQIMLSADNGSVITATGYYFNGTSTTANGTPSVTSTAAGLIRNGAVGDDAGTLYDVIGGVSGFASLTGTGTVALKRAGIIPVSSTTAPAGAIWVRNYGRRAPLRGCSWYGGANSGLGALNLGSAPSNRNSDVGFRPAFVS